MRGASGGLIARMRARWLGRLSPGVWGAARGRGDGLRTAWPGRRQRAHACGRTGMRAGGRAAFGPADEDQRVVLAGRRTDGRPCGPGARLWRGANGATSRAERALVSQPKNNLLYPTLTDLNSKILN
jgi:hypothetical protein